MDGLTFDALTCDWFKCLVISESQSDADLDAFRPLATLMAVLRESAAADSNRQLVSKGELDYIEERALLETQRETVGRLGTIPF